MGGADESTCKPGSVFGAPFGAPMDDHPSRAAVTDNLMRSTRRLGLAALERLRSTGRNRRLLTLLRVGFTKPLQSPAALVVSYTTVSPLPPGKPDGGLFSVALSRGSPRVGVTHHPALWSPDFPRRRKSPLNVAAVRSARPPCSKRTRWKQPCGN